MSERERALQTLARVYGMGPLTVATRKRLLQCIENKPPPPSKTCADCDHKDALVPTGGSDVLRCRKCGRGFDGARRVGLDTAPSRFRDHGLWMGAKVQRKSGADGKRGKVFTVVGITQSVTGAYFRVVDDAHWNQRGAMKAVDQQIDVENFSREYDIIWQGPSLELVHGVK